MIRYRRSRSSITVAGEGESDDQIFKRLIEERAIASLDRRWNRILEGDEFFPVEEV